MIRIRVDWRHRCPVCRTELVFDYFDESAECVCCPWCGCHSGMGRGYRDEELKEFICNAVKRIEQRANSKTAVEI